MPGAYARTATQALTNVTYKYIEELADNGLAGACRRLPGLLQGVQATQGKLTLAAVGEALGVPSVRPAELIAL